MSGIDSSAGAPDSSLVSFSVHSLPSPAAALAARRTARGRLFMAFILAVCAAPVIASYIAYFVVRPDGRTNYAELIAPPRPMPAALPLADLDGRPVGAAALRGQWLLVVVAGGVCDDGCQRRLWLQRQLHESLGRDKDRVDKVWLVDDAAQPSGATLAAVVAGPSGTARGAIPPSRDAAATRDPAAMHDASAAGDSVAPRDVAVGRDPEATGDALASTRSSLRRAGFAPSTVLRVPRAALAGWLEPAAGHALEEHVYLVDPRGDWMMRAPADADAARLKRDLDRLLRASSSWDRAGR